MVKTNNPINIHKVISPFDINTVTWNSQLSYSNKIEGVINGVVYDEYNNFDITNLVKEWYLEPSKNYGVLLKTGDLEENNLNESYNFLSSEYVNNPLWSEVWVYPEPGPKLTIEFTPTLGINQYNYDTGGRLTSIFLASGGRINFEYDFNGNIKRRVYSPQ
jgi:YD repeat-containing protein